MNRFHALIVFWILSGTALAVERPNIVFLFADDQRADTIAAHGKPHIQTPNLDKMAAEGFSFRRNYCAGSSHGAVCLASRSMLMTGRRWMNLPKEKPHFNWGDAVTLPRLLSSAGRYESFVIGKWHNGKKTLDRSFSNGRSVYMGGMADHSDFQVQDLEKGTLSAPRDAGGFSSTVFADEAVSFIEKADGNAPFFLYVAFMAPHDPRNPPQKYRDMYYENRPPLHHFDVELLSSPIQVGDRIYQIDFEGTVHIFKAARSHFSRAAMWRRRRLPRSQRP